MKYVNKEDLDWIGLVTIMYAALDICDKIFSRLVKKVSMLAYNIPIFGLRITNS